MRYLLTSLILALSLPAWGVSQTRTSSFAYDANTGLLIQEVIEPDTTAYRVQTDYTYDGYGNKLTVTVSGADITTRTTTTIYDANGQFPIKTTNTLNQADTGTYDARFGTPTSLTGPNGITTTWSYDGFGRKVNETRADGTQTNVAFNLCDSTCPYNAKYYIATTYSGSPASYVYYDMLNREMRAQAQGFDGRLVTKDTQYDSQGRVSQTSLPYYVGDTVYWASFTYDQINRPIKETQADGTTNQTSYNGLTVVSTNALNQTQTQVKNSQGQLVSVTDNQGNAVSYQYDPFGNLSKTTDAKGNVVTLTYDLRGRKIAMNDPDMGYWTYQYNVLGQLVKQTDAKSQVVTMTYDVLGRMLNRTEPDLISNWTYDTQPMGVGKLTQVTSDNGYKRTYTYDTVGRVSSETSVIDTTYVMSKSYDAYSRVDTLTYPTGVKVKNVYNAYGYLAEVHNGANNALFWRANTKDALGHVLNETLGNGLNTVRSYTATTGRIAAIAVGPNSTATIQNQTFYFDSLGNLIYRYDPIQGQSESFAYDNLNRLTASTSSSGTVSLTYDTIGNITNKSDVGAYTYGAKPHAVAQVNGALNATYTYDANGNMTGGNGRAITYTSYNAPSQIVTSSATVSFVYDADHQRLRQTSTSETMIYLNPRIDAGAHFEKETKGGVTTYQHYLYGSAGVIGMYSTTSTTAVTQYFHSDHLGSIVAVTDDSANVLARYKFDAWGKRIPLAGDPTTTHHGFTGHEHLDDVGLIHMNGRVYDPVLGRFISADPYIQAPDNLQSYNRYAYVWNNPLSATDPSGYWKLGKWLSAGTKAAFEPTFKNIFAAIRSQPGQVQFDKFMVTHPVVYAVAEIVIAVYSGGVGNVYLSAYYSYLSTGSGTQAARAAAIAYVTSVAFNVVGSYTDSGTFANVIGHAAVGCASSVASGGSCQSGAVGAAFGALADNIHIGGVNEFVGGLVIHSIAGGIGSELGGGKFSNGAVMGAFGYLFNRCAHNGCWTTKEERAYLDRGDFRGYHTEACSGGDLNACRFYGIATGEEPGPSAVLRKALLTNGYSFAETNTLVQSTIPLDLANDYANLLPQSEAAAAFPSAQAITRYHWTEFGKYGLPPSTFGGTPFGNSLDRLVPSGLWCSLCAK